MEFKISEFKLMEKNTLNGFFTFSFGPIQVEGWTYHVKNDKSWVNPPSREYIDPESGEKRYSPIIRIPDKDRYWKFQNWAVGEVKRMYDEAKAKAGQSGTQTLDEQTDDLPF